MKLVSVIVHLPSDIKDVEAWRGENGLRIIKSLDDTNNFGPLLHLSVSHAIKFPTWEEVSELRWQLLPKDVDFVIPMPRKINDPHPFPYCIHLQQYPGNWTICNLVTMRTKLVMCSLVQHLNLTEFTKPCSYCESNHHYEA